MNVWWRTLLTLMRARVLYRRRGPLPPDAVGRIQGLTQRRAFELQAAGQRDARIANVLYGVGGGLAIAGGTFFFISTRVAVVPAPGSIALTGALP